MSIKKGTYQSRQGLGYIKKIFVAGNVSFLNRMFQ
jgi:hypothetical protein